MKRLSKNLVKYRKERNRKGVNVLAKYIAKRILLAIVSIWIITMITFFAMNAIPGGPFNKEKATDPAVIATLEARYNLDKPVGEQYILYMKNLLQRTSSRSANENLFSLLSLNRSFAP